MASAAAAARPDPFPTQACGVFDAVARLLNPEVDLIFFDTTSTYFVFRDRAARRLVWRDQHERVVDTDIDTNGGDGGALAAGATERAGSAPMGSRRTTATTSQVVVGMAVARDGI